MVIKPVRQIEQIETREEKIDLSLFKKRSSAKTPAGLVIGMAKKLSNSKGNVFTKMEMLQLFSQLHRDIRNLETSEKVKLESWKRKSSFSIKPIPPNKPKKFIVITYQKPSPDEEPREIKKEISRDEVNDIIYWINRLTAEGRFYDEKKKVSLIPTSEIAERFYRENWKVIFSNRYKHFTINSILRLLNELGIIHYKGGYTQVLKKVRDIQTDLKWKK